MLNHKELKLLKSGQIQFIPLPEGYRLYANEDRQVYISKGGKKRYYLSDAFIKHMYTRRNVDQTIVLVKAIVKIQEMIKKMSKNTKTKMELIELLDFINSEIG